MLPARLRPDVRALSGSVESFGGGRTPVDADVLMTLARACRDEVEVGFDYPSRPTGGGVRRRRVEPYRLVASDRRWYLLAFDLDRDDWRTFRVDRMQRRRRPHGRGSGRAQAPDAASYVQEGVASRVYAHQARFLVHAAGRRGARPGAGLGGRRPGPRRRALRGRHAAPTTSTSSLLHLALLGHDFEVLEPPELRDRCAVLAGRLLAAGRAHSDQGTS